MGEVTTLAPWFGSARMIAERVGEVIGRRSWIGIPFAGGMCEVARLQARSISANDVHRHLINLAEVCRWQASALVSLLQSRLYHPDTLQQAQQICVGIEAGQLEAASDDLRLTWAAAYFVCCWMSRSGNAGTKTEFSGTLSVRWEASGGDSAGRFRSALESLLTWSEVFTQRNVTFTTLDCFEFLDKCQDRASHAIYCDPPFLAAGLKYRHAPTQAAERAWHQRLAQRLAEFQQAQVVVRAYQIPELEPLYPREAGWERVEITGRKQTNEPAAEVLLVRN